MACASRVSPPSEWGALTATLCCPRFRPSPSPRPARARPRPAPENCRRWRGRCRVIRRRRWRRRRGGWRRGRRIIRRPTPGTWRGRWRLAHRGVVIGADRDELLAGLAAVQREQPVGGVVTGKSGRLPGEVAFVFPGQGSQWAGMARALYDTSPVFRAELQACAEALRPHCDWSLLDVLLGVPGAPGFERVDVVQPALFAVMVALAAVWRSLGVRPGAVIGHSQGEIAAAYVSGALSLPDAAKVVALRSRALLSLAGTGGMASVPLTAERVEADLDAYGDRLYIAAFNGPELTVVAGEPGAVGDLVAAYNEQGVRARAIDVDYASHGRHVEVLREELLDLLGDVSPRTPQVPFYSTLTGERLDTTALDAEYWFRNLRNPVRFEQATRALVRDGGEVFVEISPHPVLSLGLGSVAGESAVVAGSLRRDQGGWDRMLVSAAEVYTRGVPVDWASLCGQHPSRVDLPTYAFQRERYWLSGVRGGDAAAWGLGAVGHPLLGAATELPDDGGVVLSGRLSAGAQPWLADHRVLGRVVVPGAALAEMAVRAGDEAGTPVLRELVIQVPLMLDGPGAVQVRVTAGAPAADGSRPVAVHSRPENGGGWACHAEGTLAPGGAAPEPAGLGGAWPPAGAVPAAAGEEMYQGLAAGGLAYGPAFRGLRAAWTCGQDVYGEVTLPEQADGAGFGVHPALLDAALHAVSFSPALPPAAAGAPLLPFAWAGVRLHATGATRARVRVSPAGDGTVRVELADAAGGPLLTADSLTLRPAQAAALTRPAGSGDGLLRLEWALAQVPRDAEPGPCAVLGQDVLGLGAPAWDGGEVPPLVAWAAPGGSGPDGAAAAAVAALEAVQAWLAAGPGPGARLAVVTVGGINAGPGESADEAAAAVWGLVRAAQAENPGQIVLVDAPAGLDAARLAVLAGLGEPQVAVRGGEVRVARLAAMAGGDSLPISPAALTGPEAGPVRVAMTEGGTAGDLRWLPAGGPAEPGPGQVRVAVRAAGLNFKDVVVGLGMVEGDAGNLGLEAAGTVTAVGAGVTGLAAGDRVMGLCPGAFASSVTGDARGWVKIPGGWSYAQAASVPLVFLTAYYGLVTLGGLQSGESVLVHAAAGGVGMAAVQLARHLGATAWGTASPAKQAAVAALGVEESRIASSRTLDFEEAFGPGAGAGVDVVLNSLAGEFVDASLRLLAPGGRFLEMGKTDIRTPQQAAAVRGDVSYRAFDLMDAGWDHIAEMLAVLTGLFEAGELAPLPVTAFGVRQAPAAFRFMSQARHTGKIVLVTDKPLDPAGTVLVTGGTGDRRAGRGTTAGGRGGDGRRVRPG